MDKITRTNLDNLRSEDKALQNKAFFYILEATDKPVDWAYDVWDEMVVTLSHKDNHQRAIAAPGPLQPGQERPREQDAKGFCCSTRSDERREVCHREALYAIHMESWRRRKEAGAEIGGTVSQVASKSASRKRTVP